MISTLTMNPSLDYYMEVDGPLEISRRNRSELEYYEAGGKGINVSIVLNNLGIPTNAFGFVGGFTKNFYISLLAKYEEIRPNFTYIDGHTRINVKCHAEDHVNINATGPYVTDASMKDLARKIDRLGEHDYLVVAGVCQDYLEDDLQAVLNKAIEEGVRICLDTNVSLMKAMLPSKPYLLKTTNEELAQLVGRELPDKESVIAAAKEIYEAGAQRVIVLLDNSEVILVYHGGTYECEIAHEAAQVNTVGTGDSLTAGFLMDYLRTRDTLDSLRFAASCGAATAYSRGLATREKIDSFYEQTEVHKID